MDNRQVLHHHADLLRQRAAAHRAHLHHRGVRCHRAAQAHARHRHLLPYRHRRARAEDRALRERRRLLAEGVCRRRRPPSSAPSGTGWTSATTISSAPPIPATCAASRRCSSSCRSAASSTKASTAANTACSTNSSSMPIGPGAPCPDCGRPTETVDEENYFFKLSAMEEPLLKLYDAAPRLHPPRNAPQ